MHNHQSSYNRWNWIVALILAFILLWMLFTGRGPNNACCVAPADTVAESSIPATSVTGAFGFTATANDFSSNGDSTNVSWVSKADELKALLTDGDSLQAQGDDKDVVLRGTVANEAVKVKKGADIQAFFGTAVEVDNQLLVKASEPPAVLPPPPAKLYFETGKTALPSDSDVTLAPVVEWLNTHPTTKAIISGFHDSRGNRTVNEDLAYGRAKAAHAALITAGVDVMRIEMRKPEVVDGGDDLAEARRVEVSIE